MLPSALSSCSNIKDIHGTIPVFGDKPKVEKSPEADHSASSDEEKHTVENSTICADHHENRKGVEMEEKEEEKKKKSFVRSKGNAQYIH